MTFQDSVKTCFSKYVTFSGRAQRSEFWWFILFVMIANAILIFIDIRLFGTTTVTDGGWSGQTDTPILSGIFGLAIILPGLSVAVRRLHDLDKSGWWYWIVLVPLIGMIVLIVWYATEGTRGPNRYGDDPLNPGAGGGADDGDYAASSIPPVPRD